MNGKPIILAGPPPIPEGARFTLISGSLLQTEVVRRYSPADMEWQDGDIFIVDCHVQQPIDGKTTIPIVFDIEGLGPHKNIIELTPLPKK